MEEWAGLDGEGERMRERKERQTGKEGKEDEEVKRIC